MKRIAYFLMGLILAFTICACSSAGNSPYTRDYDYLWDELENSYPYLAYLRDDMNIDLDEIRARYAKEAEAAADEDDFAQILQKMFSELNNFAHLDLVTPEMYQGYYYAYVYDNNYVFDRMPFTEILQDSRISKIYVKPETPEEHILEIKDLYPDVWVQYYTDCNALYLRIPSFAHELIERDGIVINDALAKYPETKNIIFDITNNAGGSDYYWERNLVAPLGGSYSVSYRSYFKKSDITDRYYGDYESNDIPDDAPEWVAQLGLDRCFENRWTLPEEKSEEKDIKKWVLTSENVYSAADKFVNFCKQTGWATVVGTRTSGDGLQSTPILLLLPDSGLLVRFSAIAGENPGGNMNAAGTMPDIVCVKNENALDRCLEIIRGE